MSGLAPGQLQHITYPILGLDDDFLIEAVDIRREYEGYIYSVTAIQGPEEGSWTRLFKNLSNQIKLISDRINIGIDETLIIAEDVAEWFGMEEDVSETPYACPLIGSSTVCGSTMIVC